MIPEQHITTLIRKGVGNLVSWLLFNSCIVLFLTYMFCLCYLPSQLRPYKENFLFPVPARITFGECIKKIVILISLYLMYFALQLIFFRWKKIHFSLKLRFYTISRSASTIEIHFSWYVQNVKSFLSQKSRFDLVERIKNENKNRTRASLFQSSEDGKQEFFMWPNEAHKSYTFTIYLYTENCNF